MGILGNFLKTAAIIGASAIPGVGAVAGPVVAGALGGPGLSNKLIAGGSAAVGNALKGGEAPVGDSPISAPNADVKGTAGFASDIGGGTPFTPDMVAKDPLGQIAALQVMNGSEDLTKIFSSKRGLGLGRF